MNKTIAYHLYALVALIGLAASCKKNKQSATASDPPASTPTPQEVITTLRVYVWDSISNTPVSGSPFTFKDPDGDGGQQGGFLNNGQDSVICLQANKTYKTRIVILDETKNPVDSTSAIVAGSESYEHMLFYNGNPANAANAYGNNILNTGYPNYTVKLNGSGITIRYTDADNASTKGKATRNIGLQTILKTAGAYSGKFPLVITLRHQPDGAKDGSYLPGETDIEVTFKVCVN